MEPVVRREGGQAGQRPAWSAIDSQSPNLEAFPGAAAAAERPPAGWLAGWLSLYVRLGPASRGWPAKIFARPREAEF